MDNLTELTIEDVIEMKDDMTFERLQKLPVDLIEMMRRELMIELRALEKSGMYQERQGAIRSSIDLCSMFMTVEKGDIVSYSVSTISDLSVISDMWHNTIKPSLVKNKTKNSKAKSRIPVLKSSFWSKPIVAEPEQSDAMVQDDQAFKKTFNQKGGTNGVVRLKR